MLGAEVGNTYLILFFLKNDLIYLSGKEREKEKGKVQEKGEGQMERKGKNLNQTPC